MDTPLTTTRRGALGALATGALLSATGPAHASTPDPRPRPLRERVRWGAYADGEPYPDCASHVALERTVGTRLPVMSWFSTWATTWPRVGGAQAAAGGYDVHFAWSPHLGGRRPVLFADVLAGRYVDYLGRFFDAVAAFPGEVTIRFGPEVNGKSFPWSMGYTAGPRCMDTPEQFGETFAYLVHAQRRHGAPNVRWAFNTTTKDFGGVVAEDYWPGADVVDVVSVDLYNGYGGWWLPPAKFLRPSYDRLTALHPTAPVWLSEFGCREPSKDEPGAPADPRRSKAQWIREFAATTEFPRLETVCLFNAPRAHDWRVNSSPGALREYRAALGG